ncbi:MAG: glycosyltransferase family 4 protein [Dehalococcoidia bacterium]
MALAGHPFQPIGMGEHIRCTHRALRSAGYTFPIRDIYALNNHDDANLQNEFGRYLAPRLSNNINIFHINGNEVEQALAHVKNELSPGAFNIIYPFWELAVYPKEWAEQLNRFEEIWAPSQFIYNSISKAVTKPVFHMPMSAEIKMTSFLSRRYFALPEDAYLFIFYFDFRSFIERKNPFAVIHAFEEVREERPDANIGLVIKLNTPSELGPRKSDYDRFMAEVNKNSNIDKMIVINKILTDNETKNLVRCCDCFVSLHRSEGFGRGTAEAMYMGKPVIATGYSGNMDYMNPNNSCLIDYKLVAVEEGSYPYDDGQVWADADVKQAVSYMLKLIDDPDYGRRLGEIASRHIRTYFSYRAAGLRYATRLDEICSNIR